MISRIKKLKQNKQNNIYSCYINEKDRQYMILET